MITCVIQWLLPVLQVLRRADFEETVDVFCEARDVSEGGKADHAHPSLGHRVTSTTSGCYRSLRPLVR